MHGGDALQERLDQLAGTPTRNWLTQFRQLSRSGRGYEFMRSAGVTGTAATQRSWLAERASASPANQAAIGRAYTSWWRANRATALTRRLAAGDNGTTVEVHPLRDMPRHITIQNVQVHDSFTAGVAGTTDVGWNDILPAWQANNRGRLMEIGEAIAEVMYPPRVYIEVDHLGFG